MVSTTKAAALFGSLVVSTAMASTEMTSDKMGAGAFIWPPDRPWIGGHDQIAPCGSTDGVGERTPFPLSAYLSIVQPRETFLGYKLTRREPSSQRQACSCHPGLDPRRPH